MVRIIYRALSQGNYLKVLNNNMNKIDSVNNEIYILGDFNINLYLNNSGKKKILNNKSISSDVKSYHEFCTSFALKQLIKVPARVTLSGSTIIDHILASFLGIVTH